MHSFEYFAPKTIEEAVILLGDKNRQTSVIAGGTDLIVEIKEHIHWPDCLVDINKIEGLNNLSYDDNEGLTIGAQTRVRTVEQSAIVKNNYPGIYQAVSQLGSVQVRNRATVIGNICRASPSADTPPPLMAAGTSVSILGPEGERRVKLENFFTGPGQTVLEPGEILIHITVPPPQQNTGLVYLKLGRRKAMELATVGVAVSLRLEGEICKDVRIVLGAVAPTPIRARLAEELLEGEKFEQEIVTKAAQVAMTEASPISDVRSSADYRREMVAVYTEKALIEARQQAQSK